MAFEGSEELCWLDTCSRAEVALEGVALGARRAGEARQWSRQVLSSSGWEGRWYSKHVEQREGPRGRMQIKEGLDVSAAGRHTVSPLGKGRSYGGE